MPERPSAAPGGKKPLWLRALIWIGIGYAALNVFAFTTMMVQQGSWQGLATTLAMTRRAIPACHYMVAVFGGTDVKCSGYARYGTEALSREALAALDGRTGCLLANHGAITIGSDLDKAMWRMVELETLAQQYHHSLLLPGGPVILSDAEIAEVLEGFGSYGLQSRDAVAG